MTTVFDAAGKGSAKASWALMGRARADTVEPQSAAAKPSPFSRDASCKIKKPDMYWSAPRGTVRPVISAVEIGYVRRSEIDEAAKTVVLADGTPLTVHRFDDHWISAARGDTSYELDRQNGNLAYASSTTNDVTATIIIGSGRCQI